MPELTAILGSLGDPVVLPEYEEEDLAHPEDYLYAETGTSASTETPAERRARHHRMCGTYVSDDDIAKGLPYQHLWWCRHPDCEKCNCRRATELKEYILQDVLGSTTVNILYLPNTEATNTLLSQLGRENYKRLPGTDVDTILINAEHELGATLGQQLTPEVAESLDYYTLALRVEGRKKSGMLGRESQVVAEEEGEKAKILRCTVFYEREDGGEQSAEDFEAMKNDATWSTINLRPTDVPSLNASLAKLAVAKVAAFQALGYKTNVQSSWVTRKVPLLRWGDSREKLAKNYTLLLDLHKQEQEAIEARLA